MKISTVNTTLIMISIIILLSIAYIIYSNRGSEQIVGITIKSFLIPALAGAGLLFIEFMKPLEKYKKTIHLGLVDDPNIMLRLNNNTDFDLSGGIMDYATLLSQIKEDEEIKELKYEEISDFVQVFILNMMIKRYPTHWYSTYDKDDWFFETGASTIYSKDGAEKRPLKITLEALKKKFSENKFLNSEDNKKFFHLPSGSSITLSDQLKELIVIKTKNLKLSFNIDDVSSATLPYSAGKTAEHYRKKLGKPLDESYRIDFFGVSLSMNIHPNRFKRWAPNTIKEIEWAKELGTYIENRISWELFQENTK